MTFNRKFSKRFDKVPQKIKNAFEKRLSLFVKDVTHPQLNKHKLKGKRSDCWSINITGDWRAIYREVNGEIEWIEFIELGTHSELYK